MKKTSTTDINSSSIEKLLKLGAMLMDVRELDEFSKGTIPGAKHLALSELPTAKDEVPTTSPIILFCRSGRRSSKAAKIIRHWTHQDIYCLMGGYTAYCEFAGT